MIDFEEYPWQLYVFLTITILLLIYTVYLSVKDRKWEDRTWAQKLATILAAIFVAYMFFMKLMK